MAKSSYFINTVMVSCLCDVSLLTVSLPLDTTFYYVQKQTAAHNPSLGLCVLHPVTLPWAGGALEASWGPFILEVSCVQWSKDNKTTLTGKGPFNLSAQAQIWKGRISAVHRSITRYIWQLLPSKFLRAVPLTVQQHLECTSMPFNLSLDRTAYKSIFFFQCRAYKSFELY